jgi:hypothetical protein
VNFIEEYLSEYVEYHNAITSNLLMGKALPSPTTFKHFNITEEPKYLVWGTDAAAGLGNRLYGLVATFALSLVSKRIFLTNWPTINDTFPVDPVDPSKTESLYMIPLDDIIESNFNEWRASVIVPQIVKKKFQPADIFVFPFGMSIISLSFVDAL